MDLPHNKTIGGGTQTEPTTFLWKNECESDLRVMYARVTKWWHYVQKIEVKGVKCFSLSYLFVPSLLGFPLRKHSQLQYNFYTRNTPCGHCPFPPLPFSWTFLYCSWHKWVMAILETSWTVLPVMPIRSAAKWAKRFFDT